MTDRKGFIFDPALCVACRSCSAACMLANGWETRVRTVFSNNSNRYYPDPVINISMACNHCEEPSCQKGCPASAFRFDINTGAVLTDPGACIGCRYCTWTCPYDSPKFSEALGIIEKCHYCNDRLASYPEPACSAACPTGALSYGLITEKVSNSTHEWFPEKGNNPSMLVEATYTPSVVKEIPEPTRRMEVNSPVKRITNEWSLVVFTFLLAVSASFTMAGIESADKYFSLAGLIIAIAAGPVSLLHLGKPLRAWRALSGIRTSALSREIAGFLLYLLLQLIFSITGLPAISILLQISAFLLLFLVDDIYTSTSGNKAFHLHSGQTLLTGLLLTALLMKSILPFAFVAILKIILIFTNMLGKGYDSYPFPIRFIRFALLLVATISLVSGRVSFTLVLTLLVFAGELIDRFLYYYDFSPYSIVNTIKRGKNEREKNK